MRFIALVVFSTVDYASTSLFSSVQPHNDGTYHSDGCFELTAPNWRRSCWYGGAGCDANDCPGLVESARESYEYWIIPFTALMDDRKGSRCQDRFVNFREGYDTMLVSEPPADTRCELMEMNGFFSGPEQAAALVLMYYYVPNAWRWIGENMTVSDDTFGESFLRLSILPAGDLKDDFARFMIMHYIHIFMSGDFKWTSQALTVHHEAIHNLVENYVATIDWSPVEVSHLNDTRNRLINSDRTRLLYEFLHAIKLSKRTDPGARPSVAANVFEHGSALLGKKYETILDEVCPLSDVLEPAWIAWSYRAKYGVKYTETGLVESAINAGLISHALEAAGDAEQARASIDWLKTRIATGDTDLPADLEYLVSHVPHARHYQRQALLNVIRKLTTMVVTPARDNGDGDKIPKSKLALAKALALFSKLEYVAKTEAHSPDYIDAMAAINAMFAQVDVYKSNMSAVFWKAGNVQKIFADIGPHVAKLLATAEFSAN